MAYSEIRLTRKRLLAAKAEGTRGTYQAPAATDVFEVTNLGMPTINAEKVTWLTFRDTLTRDPDAVKLGTVSASISFSIAFPFASMAGGVITTWNTNYARFINACGAQTAVSTDLTMTPDDDAVAGLSLLFNVDGISYQMRGCAGTCEIVAEAGQHLVANFEFEGVVEDVLEAASLGIATIVSQTPEIVENLGLFTIADGVTTITSCPKTFTIRFGTTRTPLYCQAGDKGISYYYISDRAVTGTAVIAAAHGASDQADDELIGMWQDSDAVTVTWAYGATAGAAGTTILLYGTISDLQMEDDAGVQRWNMEIDGARATAEGEFNIELAATSA